MRNWGMEGKGDGEDSSLTWSDFSWVDTPTMASLAFPSISRDVEEVQDVHKAFHASTKTRTRNIRLQALLSLSLACGGVAGSTGRGGGEGKGGGKNPDGEEYERLGREWLGVCEGESGARKE